MNVSNLIVNNNGIYIIRQQMPYPLKENNAYLAETDKGWAVIDLGIDIPATRDLWKTAVDRAGITFSSIKKIIITHCHPDHLGAARWMQEMTGAPVYMSEADRIVGSAYVFLKGDKYSAYRKAISGAAGREGFDEDKISRLVTDWCDNVVPFFPEPEYIETLHEDQEIMLNGYFYQVKIFSGHSDGQILLWCKENRTLFSGDIFTERGYLHFADWPHTNNENPLKGFLSSLDMIERMNPEIIYTGHGRPVTLYKEIFAKLRYRHNKYLEIFEKAVTEPVTAGSLYMKVFQAQQSGEIEDYIHAHRIQLGEARGYLNFLVNQSRLYSKTDGGKILYFPADKK